MYNKITVPIRLAPASQLVGEPLVPIVSIRLSGDLSFVK